MKDRGLILDYICNNSLMLGYLKLTFDQGSRAYLEFGKDEK